MNQMLNILQKLFSKVVNNGNQFVFRSTRGFMHMRICRGTEGYTLGGAATAFPTVPALMRHYVTAQRLPVRGAEHMALSTPLPAVML